MSWSEPWRPEKYVRLCSYAASSGNTLPTFRHDQSVPSSKVKDQERRTVQNFLPSSRPKQVSQGNSFGIATRYALDRPGVEFRSGRDLPHPSGPGLGPTHSPIIPGLFPVCKRTRAWRRTTHPHLTARLKKEYRLWAYILPCTVNFASHIFFFLFPLNAHMLQNGLAGLPVSWSPTIFSGSGPLTPGLTKKKIWKFAIFRPTRRSLLPRTPGWTDNLLNYFFDGLQKLEERAKKCIGLRWEYVE